MMIQRTFMLILFCCFPLLALAQDARVRSGEHEGFTRLVAPIPTGAAWDIEHLDRTITFSVPGSLSGFDISNIYQLIDRDRIADVRSDIGKLIITLGCDCRVAPFVVQERFVVLDIGSPGVSLAASTIEKRASELEQAEGVEVPTPRSMTISLPILPKQEKQTGLTTLQPADLPLRVREPLSGDEQTALNAMQQRLLKELSAATTRGVLSPKPGRPIPNIASSGLTEIADPASPEEMPLPDLSQGSVNSMRVTTSNDLPSIDRQMQEIISVTGRSCPTRDEVDIANWGDDRAFHEQISEARQNLYQEFDKLDAKQAVRLAQTYIYFGFGAEALEVLALDPSVASSNTLLHEIAHIMEFGSAPSGSSLAALVDCETDVALWAILAKDDLDIDHTLDPSSALLALNRLPIHLRRFLAPATSERFLSHGDNTAAATALRSLERTPSALPSAAKLAQARISIDEGDLKAGTTALEDVIDDNTEQSPEALIDLVETRLSANQPVDGDTASLIAAYAKELRDTDLGPALRRAHVLALARSGQFDQGFKALKDLGGDAENEAAIELRLQLLKELTAAAEDVTFLDYVFDQLPRDIDRLPLKPKITLAERLLDLGFATRAESVISSISENPPQIERQILMARIALALEQPQRAFAALVEVANVDADILRAQAKQMAGEHRDAVSLYQRANKPDAAITAAWLGDDVDGPILSEDPVFGPVMALTAVEPDVSISTNGMLARSDAVLRESESARETLEAFLAKPQVGSELQ